MTRIHQLVLPAPHSAKQAQVVTSPVRFTCVEAGTKAGKTSAAILWIIRRAWERSGSRWWWLAPYNKQARIAFRRISRMLRRAGVPIEIHRGDELWIRLITQDSTIEFRSGENPDSLYGEDVHGAVIDEAARFKEQSFYAVRSTLTFTQGPMLIISTPRGKRSWFWKLCQRAKDPLQQQTYRYYHLRTIDNPFIPKEEVEQARDVLPAVVFAELYEADAQDDAAAVFRNLDTCKRGAFGNYQVGVAYTAGIDLARRQNFTVNAVMDAKRAQLVAFDRFTRIDWHLQKERLANVVRSYHAAALVDATGLGDPIVEDLQRMVPGVEGYVFNAQSKQALIEHLAVQIEQGAIGIPDVSELQILFSELEAYGYEVTRTGYRYAPPEGMTDDCVIALALAVWQAGTPTIADMSKVTAVGRRDMTAMDA